MSIRITSRSRPRLSDYPWPLTTMEATLEEMRDASPSGGTGKINAIGPLTMAAVMELLYRVNEIDYSAEIKYTPPSSSQETASRSDTLSFMPKIFDMNYNELDLWTDVHAQKWDEILYQDEGSGILEFSSTFAGALRVDLPALIFLDENGKFWINGFLFVGPGITSSFDGIGNHIIFNGELQLASGTQMIELLATDPGSSDDSTFDEVSAIFTPSSWWPYRTTAEDPAWDAATGLPINGGPGA